jgi:hypothetical protein
MGAAVPLMVTWAPAMVVFSLPPSKLGLQEGGRQELPSVRFVPNTAAMLPGATVEPARV